MRFRLGPGQNNDLAQRQIQAIVGTAELKAGAFYSSTVIINWR
jgi:hypothetical protein